MAILNGRGATIARRRFAQVMFASRQRVDICALVQLVSFLLIDLERMSLPCRKNSLSSSRCSVIMIHWSAFNMHCSPSHLSALYAIVYGSCIWVLTRRKREGYTWHIVTSTILFTLATLQVAELITILAQMMNMYETNGGVFPFELPHPIIATQMVLDATVTLSL